MEHWERQPTQQELIERANRLIELDHDAALFLLDNSELFEIELLPDGSRIIHIKNKNI